MNLAKKNTGNALFVVVVLLLLASVMSLFAMNVGVFEQRASGNDVRAKLVNEVAEAGLAQGMEYLRENSTLLTTIAGNWEKCTATDTSFPCGSILEESKVKVVAADGTVTLEDMQRRSSMYYWKGGVGHDFDASGAVTAASWETRMLPIANAITTTNGFPVNYGVGAVLCRVAFKDSESDPTECTDDDSKASPSSVITLVSVGSLPTESARTTLTQTVGSYNILNNPPNKPPILAAGSVNITGGIQIVTNPNAGGAGVPVSVWTRKDLTKTGTPNTCYIDEFLRYGAKNNSPPTLEGTSKIEVCDTCKCPSEHSISYQNSGSLQQEGMDILDVELPNTGINRNVLPEEFPCDLFENVFRVKAWENLEDLDDNFCETKIMTTYKNPNTGASVSMGVDEAFLYTNAARIIPRDTAAEDLLKPSQELTFQPGEWTYPSETASGLVWCQKDCGLEPGTQMGSPDKPVLLVIDGLADIKGRVFGMIFVRSTGNTLAPDTGGDATLKMTGPATVYGTIIIQGEVTHAQGTAAVIHSKGVLTNLDNDPGFDKFGGVPGGWADDRVSY